MTTADDLCVAFQIYNRRGLGHLVRSLNLARALRELAPATEAVFYARSPPPDGFVDPEIELVVEPDAETWKKGWPPFVESTAPRVIVYDTMLDAVAGTEPAPATTRRVYVMRRCKPERQSSIFTSPALDRIDLFIVPHTADEFGYTLPTSIADRTAFVGPIVRAPDPRATARLRSKYDLGHETFLLTSTPGGGGFESDAEGFFDVVGRVHRKLAGSIEDFRHVLVPGPRFPREVPAPPGVTVSPQEPDMVELLALSDVVISAGGYNTVNEIRVAGAPAIFLAGDRTHDDQHERVGHLARRGQAWLPPAGPVEEVAAGIAEVCLSSKRLETMRRRHAEHRVVPGNLEAARHILRALAS